MNRRHALILAVVTLAFGAAPFLSEPFRGYPPEAFPVVIPRPSVQPAGYAFSIWALIYLLLLLHAVTFVWRRHDDDDWLQTAPALTLSLLIGSVWLYIAPQWPLLAEAAILAMAATALLAFLRADTFSDRLTLALPLGIYAGWLSAAAAVSTGVILAGYGFLSDSIAALAMLVLIVALVLGVQMRQPRAPEYGLTALWALIGVMAANWGQNVIVFLAATLAALALAAAQGLLILRLRRGR